MASILVTGGCGYIGSHTVLSLLEKGLNVYVIDSNENSSALVINRIRDILKKNNLQLTNNLYFVKGDVRISDDLEKVFLKALENDHNIYGVIHFAGLKAVEESCNSPLLYWDTNLVGTITLLKVMKKYNCRNLIFSGSATIYSNSIKNKLKEDSLIKPINPYGRTKAAVEILLNDIFLSDNKWKIINLRYFNPIGAHQSGEIGEDPIGVPNNIFPLILNVAAKKINELKVYGKDWNTKDGTCIRDYIHVMDLADGHIAALNYLQNNSSQILHLNIGTGIGNSVLDLINIFQEVNNVEVPYSFVNRREGDKAEIIADNTKILSTLNWEPKRSLKNMCLDGWKWHLMNPNGYSL